MVDLQIVASNQHALVNRKKWFLQVQQTNRAEPSTGTRHPATRSVPSPPSGLLEMTILDGELKAGKVHVVNNKAIVILISIEYKAKKLD